MFDYQLIRSKRKTIAIQVTRDGKVVVRAPLFSTDRQIAKFVEEHEDWVTEKLGEAENDDRISSLDFTPAEIRVYKKRAQGIISRRVAHSAGEFFRNRRFICFCHHRCCCERLLSHQGCPSRSGFSDRSDRSLD